jgi:prepilin-type N-terminal cleavage/methylation domain-containing protein/prepilin-type processing-associated H-X9-DG protein
MSQKNRAFTLVELLVVMGIIAVLTAVLLPAMNRAREQANQITCLSNLRQLSMAIIMYCQDNEGWFPRAAPYAVASAVVLGRPTSAATQGESTQDYIWWQQVSHDTRTAPNRDIFNSPILKYLGFKSDSPPADTKVNFNEQRQCILRCPSDPLLDHPDETGIEPDGSYFYSYSLNNLMQSLDPGISDDGYYLPINIKTGKPFVVAGKLVRVRNPSLKILFVEESDITIDDGSFDPTEGTNLLSVRHDHSARFPPDSPLGYIQVNGVWTVRNGQCRGNVSFCDGHADFVPRAYVNDPNYKLTDDIACYDPFY